MEGLVVGERVEGVPPPFLLVGAAEGRIDGEAEEGGATNDGRQAPSLPHSIEGIFKGKLYKLFKGKLNIDTDCTLPVTVDCELRVVVSSASFNHPFLVTVFFFFDNFVTIVFIGLLSTLFAFRAG
jgi:hypothetical protein